MKQFFRLLKYGWLLNYHTGKQDKFSEKKHRTVLLYHYEMAQYYYEKIYGEPYVKPKEE